jgi:uncharacterized protein involved in exopolysaccharide biosynthesis
MLDVATQREADHFPFAPHVGPLAATRRHWVIVLLVTVAFTAAGVYAGFLRSPVYTAESRLAVGRIDVSAPGALAGFSVATQALAAQYSRTVDATGVVEPAAAKVGLSPAEVASRVDATPIPESPVIKVFGRGPNGGDAVRLANAAAAALVAYTTQLNRSNPDSPRLLKRFRDAATVLLRARARADGLQRANQRAPTADRRRRLQRARVDVQVAQLRADTAKVAYDTSTRSQAATALVQVMQRARDATSDRSRYTQFLGFAGFVAGLTVGVGLATLQARRRLRKQLGF